MMQTLTSRRIMYGLAIGAILIALPGILVAQQPTFTPTAGGPWAAIDAPSAAEPALTTPILARALPLASRAMVPVMEEPRTEPHIHRFWDGQNTTLFGVSGGWAAADFYVTKSNLAGGGRELNPVARLFTKNTPLLATNFALETGGVIGISYFFHKSGHHRLERMASYVNISASAGAVLYGMSHR
jgi:hypothetical protein